MVCEEFIERYSEYRDGLLDDGARARFEDHLESCESCGRYEHVLTRGLALWRELPGPAASPDFQTRLQHRIYHVQDAGRLSPGQRLGSAALIAVASVGFLAVTWLPFATQVSIEVELPPVAVDAPSPVAAERPSLFEPGPYMQAPRQFYTTLGATLDEPRGLFASSYVPVRSDSTRAYVPPRTGQLDESR
jgi:hypothetical protein